MDTSELPCIVTDVDREAIRLLDVRRLTVRAIVLDMYFVSVNRTHHLKQDFWLFGVDRNAAYCAAVLVRRIMDLARPSVRLSVPYWLLTGKREGVEKSKFV